MSKKSHKEKPNVRSKTKPKSDERNRRSGRKAHSRRSNKSRPKKSKLAAKGKKPIPRKQPRKSSKAVKPPVKVQKVSRSKKQQRGTKKGGKRVPKKLVRKFPRKVRILRRPSNYKAFNDDQGLKKLYRIDLRQRTYKEKVDYITRFNFWPMINEAENLYDNQFPFGFMCMVHTRFKDMELTNADKLSPIEEAIDDPALRSHSLAAMEKFKNLRATDPRFKPTEKSDQLFKPVNIKALIIRFFYRTNK